MPAQAVDATPANPPRPILEPANRSERVLRVFAVMARRMLSRQFHAVRITPEGREVLELADAEHRPVILATTHPSWWDPLVGMLVQRSLLPSRTAFAAMDLEQLRAFRILSRIGVFGIDPEAPGAIDALREHALALARTVDRPLIGITPQGRFTDPRVPVRLRPGAAAIAAALSGDGRTPVVIAAAFEYAFWTDKRPEALVHAKRVATPGELGPDPLPAVGRGPGRLASPTHSVGRWHRAIGDAMQVASDLLADRVIARDPARFDLLLGGGTSGVNPFYDLWLRLTGRSRAVRDRFQEPSVSA